jgi:hypothetical protein
MEEIEQPTRTVSLIRVAAIVVLVFGASALAVRCVAVATESPHGSGPAGHSSLSGQSAPGPVFTLEQLGAKTGCRPKVQVDATELRQGVCGATRSSRYFLTTFASAKGQHDWLEQAKDYVAVLVGNRWTATAASRQVLNQVRAKLGGDIYQSSHGHG